MAERIHLATAHPDRLDAACANLSTTIRLHSEGSLPECLEVSMLAGAARRLLRQIYGGNFRCAWAFFVEGINGWRRDLEPRWLFNWRHRDILAEMDRNEQRELEGVQRLIEDAMAAGEAPTAQGER